MKKEKLPRWLREQRERKIKFFKKLIGVLLFLSFFFVAGLIIFKIWCFTKNSLWDGKERVNFVISSKDAYVVSLQPGEKNMVVIKIPEETLVEVTHGYGKYRVGSVYLLGEQEKIGGGRILGETIQEYLGIAMDGYLGREAIWILGVGSEQDLEKKDYTLKRKVNKLLGLLKILKGDLDTNFSKLDLFRLWICASGVRPGRITYFNLAESYGSSETRLPDGQNAYEVEPEMLEGIVKKNFIYGPIKKENFLIEIDNSTGYPEAGEKIARILTNMGADVVSVLQTSIKQDECLVLATRKLKNSYSVKKIKRVFNCKFEEGMKTGGRADIMVIIGEAYYKKLMEKE